MAADQLTDKEDQFKRRARRRLVGAVALVLLMITLLPMVLDDRSGQKASQPEITISIPSQEGPEFTSRIVPVAPASAAPVNAAPVVQVSDAAPVTKSATVARPVTVPVSESSPKPVAEVVPAAAVPVEKAEAVEEKAAAMPAKAAEAVKPAATQDKAKPAAVKKGSISVQIGVFSDAAKVRQMKANIAEKNIQCYTENMTTPKGIKYRVRCGPYAERPAAQQALDTLKTLGFNGILVTNQ